MITCPPDRVPAMDLTTIHEPPGVLRSIVVTGLAPVMLFLPLSCLGNNMTDTFFGRYS